MHRLTCLPGDHSQRDRQHRGGEGAGRQWPTMPANELAQPVAPALRARSYRPAVRVAQQVLGERLDGGVALLGRLGQRLEHDVVQIARDRACAPLQCSRVTRAVGVVLLRLQHRLRRAHGVMPQHRLLPGRIAAPRGAIRSGVGQQFVQHHAQRVDVGHRRHRLAADLLGCGVVQGEGAGARACVAALQRAAAVPVEQFGDAEIKQAHVAGGGHQDVGRLQVAVDDQVGVGMADGRADLLEHPQAGVQRGVVLTAIVGDRDTVDVLQGEVGQAVVTDAGVQQAGDVGVGEAGQDLPLAAEAPPQLAVGQARAQQLQCDLALVQTVGARGQPDLAHAAFAQQVLQPVGPHCASRHRQVAWTHRRLGQEGFLAVQRQQGFQLLGQCGVISAQGVQPLLPRDRIQLEQLVEQR